MTQDPFELLGVSPNTTFQDLQAAYQQRRAEAIAAQVNDEALQAIEDAYRAALEGLSQRSANSLMNPPPAASMYTPPPPVSSYNPTSITSQALQEQTASAGFGTITCPQCGAPNPAQVVTCQHCGSQISRTCPVCAAQIPLMAAICPRCGSAANEVSRNRAIQANDTAQRVQEERTGHDALMRQQEQRHTTRAVYGAVFYLAVAAGIIILCALAGLAYWYSNQ